MSETETLDAPADERGWRLPGFAPPLAERGCKVCGGRAPLFGAADFHRSCADRPGAPVLPPSGRPVRYHRCDDCGFLFTADLDGWDRAAFAERIYDAGTYPLVDPDSTGARAAGNARVVAGAFAASREGLALLDYGGGDGELARRLRAAGFRAESWDPMVEGGEPPARRFDLITCFEVMEHAPDPLGTAAEIARLLAPGGMLLFSTLLQPPDIASQRLGWWYAGPRNGHVSLHTAESLRRLWRAQGMGFDSLGPGLHCAGHAHGAG